MLFQEEIVMSLFILVIIIGKDVITIIMNILKAILSLN